MFGKLGEGGAEIDRWRWSLRSAQQLAEDALDCRSENVHPEEAEIVTGAQPWDVELLLRFSGCGLFEHRFDLIQALRRIHELAADRAVVGQLAFMRGLHGGDGAVFRPGNLHELLGAAFLRGAQVEMVANEEEERIVPAKGGGAVDGVRVAQRGGLFDERESAGVRPRGGPVGDLIAGLITTPI